MTDMDETIGELGGSQKVAENPKQLLAAGKGKGLESSCPQGQQMHRARA